MSYRLGTDLSYGPNVCDVMWPPVFEGVQYPFVAFFHGGGWTDTYGDKSVYLADIQRIAQAHVCACGSFNFANSYPDSINDIRAAIAWMKTLPCINPDKIILVGESSGGHLATLVAWLDQLVRAVVSNSGIYNLHEAQHPFVINSLTATLGSTKEANPFGWALASPNTYINANCPLSCIVENDPDTIMPSAATAIAALHNAGAPHEHHILPGPDHTSQQNRQAWWDILDAFLNANL